MKKKNKNYSPLNRKNNKYIYTVVLDQSVTHLHFQTGIVVVFIT